MISTVTGDATSHTNTPPPTTTKNLANMEKIDNDALIQAVKEAPFLYDTSHHEYKDTAVKAAAWERIAKDFEVAAIECQTRWKNLRDRYTRERQRMSRGMIAYSKWRLFPSLDFLYPFLHQRTRTDYSGPLNLSSLSAPSMVTANSAVSGESSSPPLDDLDVDDDANDDCDRSSTENEHASGHKSTNTQTQQKGAGALTANDAANIVRKTPQQQPAPATSGIKSEPCTVGQQPPAKRSRRTPPPANAAVTTSQNSVAMNIIQKITSQQQQQQTPQQTQPQPHAGVVQPVPVPAAPPLPSAHTTPDLTSMLALAAAAGLPASYFSSNSLPSTSTTLSALTSGVLNGTAPTLYTSSPVINKTAISSTLTNQATETTNGLRKISKDAAVYLTEQLSTQLLQALQGDDEDIHFALSIGYQMRKLSSQQRALAKLKIQQALYDVEYQQQQQHAAAAIMNVAHGPVGCQQTSTAMPMTNGTTNGMQQSNQDTIKQTELLVRAAAAAAAAAQAKSTAAIMANSPMLIGTSPHK